MNENDDLKLKRFLQENTQEAPQAHGDEMMGILRKLGTNEKSLISWPMWSTGLVVLGLGIFLFFKPSPAVDEIDFFLSETLSSIYGDESSDELGEWIMED